MGGDSFEAYLINVGIRSMEYMYADGTLYDNIDYFRKCYEDGLSAYKALLFLGDWLDGICKVCGGDMDGGICIRCNRSDRLNELGL